MSRFLAVGWVLAILLLAGCAPDPRDAAEAERTLALTEQDVLDREQARALREETARIESEREALRAERWGRIWTAAVGGASLAAGVAGFLVVLGVGLGGFKAALGIGQAASDFATLRANLIPLNPVTRQYPMIRQWRGDNGWRLTTFGKGVYLLSNPNDGSVTALDENRAGDRQKIAGMTAAWELGIVASEARQSSDPAGVSAAMPGAAQITKANVEYLVLDEEAGDGEQ